MAALLPPCRSRRHVALLAVVAAAGCGESRAPSTPGPRAAAAPAAREGSDASPSVAGGAATGGHDAAAAEERQAERGEGAPEKAVFAGFSDRVSRLHRKAIVVDGHNDVTLRIVDEEGFDLGARHLDGHTDLVRMREGGLDAEVLVVWVKPSLYKGEPAWQRAKKMLAGILGAVKAHRDKARLALTAADVRAAESEGRVALLIGVEGAHALGDFGDEERILERIRWLHGQGVRYMTLTWMNSNPLGGSSGDAGRDKGLSELGRRAVALMNDLGMMVDVSHVSDPTFFDAVKASRLPVLASHSATRAKADHYRNLTDDMLRAVAKNDGAVCINFYSGFIDDRWRAARARAKRARSETMPEAPPLSVLVDHIDHAVKVAGADHVCLGSDFDGCGGLPAGLEDVTKMPAITAALLDRGYSDQDVLKILGGNVLRVMEANERGAKRAAER